MKRQYIYGAMILALLSAASSCSDDNLFEDTASTNLHLVTINATTTIGSIGDNSRVTLGDNGITPVWQEGDKLAVRIDDATETSELTLFSGATTPEGEFTGIVSASTNSKKMHFYYPTTAASTDGIDLTNQDGSHAEEMILFATCAYSNDPTFTLNKKTSILKFNMEVPSEATGWDENTNLSAIVVGAYSKGKLNTNGSWSKLEAKAIAVSDIKIKNKKITGYVVVIPGFPVTDLRIAITDGIKGFITQAYTKESVTLPENKVITISQPLTKALVVTASTNNDAIKSFVESADTDLTIVAVDQMTVTDFAALRTALGSKSKGTINLTLLNQESLPVSDETGALQGCDALKSVFAPNVTHVGEKAFYSCKNLVSVSMPLATDVETMAFADCASLIDVSLPQATRLDNYAFSLCTSLITAHFPEAITVGDAFYGCSSLISIILPKTTSVGGFAFASCPSLTTVCIPKTTTVGPLAFNGCNKKNISIVVDPNAKWYGAESDWNIVFKGMIELSPNHYWEPDRTNVAIYVKDELSRFDLEGIVDRKKPTNLILLNQKSLPENAFSAKQYLQSFSAPNVTTVEYGAFFGCKELNYVSLPLVENVVEKLFLGSDNLTTVLLPQATTVGECAFFGCSKLQTISLPKVKRVEEEAFLGCDSITTVLLPQATEVSERAFYNVNTYIIDLTVKKGTNWWGETYKWKSVTEVP